MKKRLFPLLLAAVLTASLTTPLAMASEAAPAADARVLWSLGLAKGVSDSDGYSDANMALDRQATRAEAVVMLVRLLGREEEALAAKTPHGFSDVPDWAAPYIGYAVEKGLSKGVGSGRFGSGDPITLRDFTTLILRALGYQDSQGDFTWDRSKDKAVELGLYSSSFSSKDSSARGALFTVSAAALAQPLKGSGQTLAGRLAQQGIISSSSLVNGIVTAADRSTLLHYQEALAFQSDFSANLTLLADITGDGVAELFLISRDDFSCSVCVYTVSNGGVKELASIYSDDTNSGRNTAYLCNVDGQNCILEYNSYLISGTDGMEANILELYRFDANGSRITLEKNYSEARIARLKENATLLVRCDGIMRFSTFSGNALADAVAHAPEPSVPAPVPEGPLELAPYLCPADYDAALALCQVMGVSAASVGDYYDIPKLLSALDGFECATNYGAIDSFTITSDKYSVEGVKVGMALADAAALLSQIGAAPSGSSAKYASFSLPNRHGVLRGDLVDVFTIDLTLEYNGAGVVTAIYYSLYAPEPDI